MYGIKTFLWTRTTIRKGSVESPLDDDLRLRFHQSQKVLMHQPAAMEVAVDWKRTALKPGTSDLPPQQDFGWFQFHVN